MLNDIILEQEWRPPEEAVENLITDNRAVFHAIYYRYGKGYSIGVRYMFLAPYNTKMSSTGSVANDSTVEMTIMPETSSGARS